MFTAAFPQHDCDVIENVVTYCFVSFYCLGLGSTFPTGRCPAGYYCTAGSASPVQHQTEEGHYSLEGAVMPVPCPLGTFQPVCSVNDMLHNFTR